MTSPTALDEFALRLGGATRRARLRMPDVDEMLLLWYPPATRTAERQAVFFPAEIERVLDTLDGVSVDRVLARTVYADADAFAAYLAQRHRLLESGNDCGRLFALCPHCRAWEADLTPLALAVGLHAEFWPSVDADRCLAIPALASALPRPTRAPADALAAQLRVEFRTADAASGGVRAAVFVAADAAADRRTAQLRQQVEHLRAADPDNYGDWDVEFAGVRAAIRLCAMLTPAAGATERDALARVATLALADFIFADNIYYLTHHVLLPDDSPLRLRCARCSGRFVPLA